MSTDALLKAQEKMREEIRRCTMTDCPLYAVRPYQGAAPVGDDMSWLDGDDA